MSKQNNAESGNIFFTSDTHYHHQKIIEYCKRPFTHAWEMNLTLMHNWNKVVTEDDVVYHLGDFAFGDALDVNRIMSVLQFRHMHFIKGNHDKAFLDWYYNFGNDQITRKVTVHDSYFETCINGQPITLCHYAMRVWNKSHHGAWHLYGHSHGTLPDDPHSLSFDCGVDCHSYTPITFKRVREIMKKKQFQAVDHHGSK